MDWWIIIWLPYNDNSLQGLYIFHNYKNDFNKDKYDELGIFLYVFKNYLAKNSLISP